MRERDGCREFNASDAARPPRRFPLGGLFAEKRENHRKAAIFALIRAGLVSFPPSGAVGIQSFGRPGAQDKG